MDCFFTGALRSNAAGLFENESLLYTSCDSDSQKLIYKYAGRDNTVNSCALCNSFTSSCHRDFLRHAVSHNVSLEYRCNNCTKVYPTIYGVSVHFSKCIKGDLIPRNSNKEFECHYPACRRSFNTKSGLGLHVRRSHPDACAKIKKDTYGRVWTEEELALLGHIDSVLSSSGRVPIGVLFENYKKYASGRTLEGVRKIRNSAKYREVLSAVMRSNSQATVINESIALDSNTAVSDSPFSSESERSGPTGGHPRDRPLVRSLLKHASDLQELYPEFSAMARRGVSDSASVLDDAVDYVVKLCFQHRNSAASTHNRRPASKGIGGSKRRKHNHASNSNTYAYVKAQHLWRKNRKALFEMIMKDSLKDSKATDSLLEPEKTFAYWKEIFQRPSPADVEPPRHVGRMSDLVWSPITENEVRTSIRKQKGKSAGPDQLTFEHLERIPPTILRALFDLILLAEHAPGHFKASRTVLIPKTSIPTDDPSQYRPISISSILLRVFHRILAIRIQSTVILHDAQRGFRPCDGCFENFNILDCILRSSRIQREPIFVASLDLAKAFDSVAWPSLFRALENFRAPKSLICYIESLYSGSYTQLVCKNNVVASRRISFGRGVKQGDPLSPLLFNMVLDEMLRSYPPQFVGKAVFERTTNSLAFADDLVLFAKTHAGLTDLVNRSITFLNRRGLFINHEKCTYFGLDLDAKKKQMRLTARPLILADGSSLSPLESTATFKYLGVTASCFGKKNARLELLRNGLDKLMRCKLLRCEQRCELLRTHLIPSLLHEFSLGRTTLGLLESADSLIRSAVKNVLTLPHYALDACIYLPIRSGGLGFPLLSKMIPMSIRRRLMLMESSTNLVTLDYVKSDHFHRSYDWCNRCLRMKDKRQHTIAVASSQDVERNLIAYAENSADGKGVKCFGAFPLSNSWITGSDALVRGRLYQHAVKIRWNLLTCSSTANRGREAQLCRFGCHYTESLCHILQCCDANLGLRIKRHNTVVRSVAGELEKLGISAMIEPHFDCESGRKIPDLVFMDLRRCVWVLDVACPFESSSGSLTRAFSDKTHKYSTAGLDSHLKRMFGDYAKLTYGGLVFGSRGSVCQQTLAILGKLGIPKFTIYLICRQVMKDSIAIWRNYVNSSRPVRLNL